MNPLLAKIHKELGIEAWHISKSLLSPCEQPPLERLAVVDIHFDGRPFILADGATRPWLEMRDAAARDGVVLEPYSGFRSYIHQRNLIQAKLEKGRALEQILTSTAIPGFSEHHSGLAVDICAKDQYVLEESFEKTDAFAWLIKNAKLFGFEMSYPRGNAKGIIYEPWHWYLAS